MSLDFSLGAADWIFEKTIVPALAAMIGYWLASLRLRKERAWDRCADAYTQILGALYHYSEWFSKQQDAKEHARPMDDGVSRRLFKEGAKALDEAKRRIAAESWILRGDVEKRIEEMETILNRRYDDYDQFLQIGWEEIDATIQDVRKMARDDIGLESRSWRSFHRLRERSVATERPITLRQRPFRLAAIILPAAPAEATC